MAQTLKWGESITALLDVGFLADAFILNSSTLNGTDVLNGSTEFVDITAYCLNIAINRGRSTQADIFNPGTLSIQADDRAASRFFDPANTASEWYSGGTVGIAPRREVKVLSGTALMFRGYVQDLDISYEMPNLSFATITAADVFSQLGQTTLTAFNPSSELTSTRVTAILDRPEVAYSTAAADRSIGTGLATCGTVAYADGDNALAAMQALQVAEDGRLFASRGGAVVFQPRITTTFATAVASLGGTATTDIPIQTLSVGYGAETLLNRISVTIEGSTAPQVASGTASQTNYGIKTLSLSNVPLNTDAAGSALAANLLNRYQNPVYRYDSVDVLINALGTANQAIMAALEIGDVVTLSKTFTVGTPTTVTQSVVIESIRHSISPARHELSLGFGQINIVSPFVLNVNALDDTAYALY